MEWLLGSQRMSGGAAALAALAGMTIAAAIAIAPVSGWMLVAVWGTSLTLIVCLTRVAMPAIMRIGLIAALLGCAFGTAAASDPTHAKRVGADVDHAISDAAAERDRAGQAGIGAATALRGARVLVDGDSWGARIGAALNGTIGGPAAAVLMISGVASSHAVTNGMQVVLIWSIGGDGGHIACGTMTITGKSPGAIIAAAGDSFNHAVAASLAGPQPSCG